MQEDIRVKPSTELIADEYEHSVKTTSNIAIHTFASKTDKDRDNINLFIETLNKNNYEIKPEHAHCLGTDNIVDILDKIMESAEKIDGLILFFSATCRTYQNEVILEVPDGDSIAPLNIQDIWHRFISSKCPGLKNKPKIFIFHVTPPPRVVTDSRKLRRFEMAITYDVAYETPEEADILIIYHKTDINFQNKFTEQLCDNINNFGLHEDIISLVTCTEPSAFGTRPMIISTLTRKFYFTASEYRGHQLNIVQKHKQVREDLKEVYAKLSSVNKNPLTKKKPSGCNTVNKLSKEISKQEASEDKNTNLKRTNTVSDSNRSNIELSGISNFTKITKSGRSSQSESDASKSRKVIDETRPRWRF